MATLYGYSGWSGSNYISRTTNFPNAAAFTVKLVTYVPPVTAGFTYFAIGDGTNYRHLTNQTTYNPLFFTGNGESTYASLNLSPDWYVVLCRVTSTNSYLWVRNLTTNAVSTSTGTGTFSNFTPTRIVIGNQVSFGGPAQTTIAGAGLWDAVLSDTDVVQELGALIPKRTANLIMDWRGTSGTTDNSGTANLTVTGTPTQAPVDLQLQYAARLAR